MPVTRPATHPLRTPHTRRALRDSAEGASGLCGTRASDSFGSPMKPVPPWWPSRSGVTMFALYKTKLSVAESVDYVPKSLARSARSSRISKATRPTDPLYKKICLFSDEFWKHTVTQNSRPAIRPADTVKSL